MKANPIIIKKPKLNYISLNIGDVKEVLIGLRTHFQLFLGDYHNTNLDRPMSKSVEPFNNVDANKGKIDFNAIKDKDHKISIIPEFKKDLDKPIKETGLMSSVFILIISYIIYLYFDLSTNQFQFVREYYNLGFFDICLGIDGCSIYFVVRPLIDNETVPLRTVTELTLRKPTNLPKVEMTRGMEHVSKVPKEVKCKSLRGKVIYIHVQIIMRSQNYNLASKTLDTKIHSFARPALFTLQQKMRLYPNFTKSGILQSVKYSTTSRASKDLSNISPKFYENADTQKLEILKENQNKSGIYQ